MRRFLPLIIPLAAVVVSCAASVECLAQSAPVSDSPQNRVVLIKLSQPVYPPLARVAGVMGDVELTLEVRRDGSVQSVEVIRGSSLLREAAVASARQSTFECRNCSEDATSSRIVYTFQLTGPEACCVPANDNSKIQQPDQPTLGVTPDEIHVRTVLEQVCICDPVAVTKVRSLKCLYIWRCAFR